MRPRPRGRGSAPSRGPGVAADGPPAREEPETEVDAKSDPRPGRPGPRPSRRNPPEPPGASASRPRPQPGERRAAVSEPERRSRWTETPRDIRTAEDIRPQGLCGTRRTHAGRQGTPWGSRWQQQARAAHPRRAPAGPGTPRRARCVRETHKDRQVRERPPGGSGGSGGGHLIVQVLADAEQAADFVGL